MEKYYMHKRTLPLRDKVEEIKALFDDSQVLLHDISIDNTGDWREMSKDVRMGFAECHVRDAADVLDMILEDIEAAERGMRKGNVSDALRALRSARYLIGERRE